MNKFAPFIDLETGVLTENIQSVRMGIDDRELKKSIAKDKELSALASPTILPINVSQIQTLMRSKTVGTAERGKELLNKVYQLDHDIQALLVEENVQLAAELVIANRELSKQARAAKQAHNQKAQQIQQANRNLNAAQNGFKQALTTLERMKKTNVPDWLATDEETVSYFDGIQAQEIVMGAADDYVSDCKQQVSQLEVEADALAINFNKLSETYWEQARKIDRLLGKVDAVPAKESAVGPR